MTAKQRKYFGKRSKRVYAVSVPRKRRYTSMARYKRGGRRSFSRGFGGIKGMIIPIGAGVADSYLDGMLPVSGVGSTLIGMVGHNETVKTIGLYSVGKSLGNILPLPGLSRGATGGML